MKNINDLRQQLFETIQDLKAGKIDVDKAKTIGLLGQVIVSSAKAEVDYMRVTGEEGTGFIHDPKVKQIERPKAEYSNKGRQTLLEKYGGS